MSPATSIAQGRISASRRRWSSKPPRPRAEPAKRLSPIRTSETDSTSMPWNEKDQGLARNGGGGGGPAGKPEIPGSGSPDGRGRAARRRRGRGGTCRRSGGPGGRVGLDPDPHAARTDRGEAQLAARELRRREPAGDRFGGHLPAQPRRAAGHAQAGDLESPGPGGAHLAPGDLQPLRASVHPGVEPAVVADTVESVAPDRERAESERRDTEHDGDEPAGERREGGHLAHSASLWGAGGTPPGPER